MVGYPLRASHLKGTKENTFESQINPNATNKKNKNKTLSIIFCGDVLACWLSQMRQKCALNVRQLSCILESQPSILPAICILILIVYRPIRCSCISSFIVIFNLIWNVMHRFLIQWNTACQNISSCWWIESWF